MESTEAGGSGVDPESVGEPVVVVAPGAAEEGQAKVEEGEEGRKLTKAEKKAKHGAASIEEPLKTWRDLIKDLLADRPKGVVFSPEEEAECTEIASSALKEIFGSVENPFKATYDIYDVFSEKDKYSRVHKCLWKTFEAWLEKCGTEEKISGWLTHEFKVEVITRCMKKNTAQLERILSLFRMEKSEVAAIVSDRVNELCTSPAHLNFREAMKLARIFDLHDHFDVGMFVIPNILKNKQDEVEQFLKGHHKITRALIKWLDDIIERSDAVKTAAIQSYVDRKIISVSESLNFTNGKKIANLLKRLVTAEFGMDESAAPIYEAKKVKDKLRYIMFDRGEAEGVFTTTTFDLVKSHVKFGSKLASDVIISLFDRIANKDRGEEKSSYYDEAELWMVYYKLDPNVGFYGNVRNYFNANPGWEERGRAMLNKYDRVSTAADKEYRLENGPPIQWIDNWEGVQGMLREVEQPGEDGLIGIDSEFRSTTQAIQQIALLQVSTIDRVFLVDFDKLENLLSQDQWKEFTLRLFGGKHMKMGFDMHSDINAYCASLPFIGDQLRAEMTRVICLKRLANDLLDADAELFHLAESTSWKERARLTGEPALQQIALNGGARPIKLADLVEVVLSESLNKTMQKSNWSHRPLREEQILYAATDAYILIRLFTAFGDLAAKKGMNYAEMVKTIENDLEERKRDKTAKTKRAKMTDEEYAQLVKEINESVVIEDDSAKAFLTDAMLSGLGKHLRRLGVDVIFSNSPAEFNNQAKSQPHRFLLSFGSRLPEYNRLYPGRVLSVDSSFSIPDQIKNVFRTFGMKLNPSEVFTRCMLCNGDQFVMAPSVLLQTLHDCAKRVGDEEDAPEEELFQPGQWKEKMEQLDPSLHGGFGCVIDEYDAEEGRFIVRCTNGVIDVFNSLVMSDSSSAPVSVKILQVQPEVVDSERPFYYICGDCGKVYWDGTHFKRYKEFVEGVIPTESSDSNISVD